MVLIGAAIPVLAFVAYDFAARPVRVQIPSEVSLGPITFVNSPIRLVPIRNAHWWRSIDGLDVQASCSCSLVASSSDHLGPRETMHVAIVPRVRPWDTSFRAELFTTAGGRLIGRTRLSGELVAPFEGWPEYCVARRRSDGRLHVEIDPRYGGAIARMILHSPGGASRTIPGPGSGASIDLGAIADEVALDGTAELELHFGEAPSARWSCWLVDEPHAPKRRSPALTEQGEPK